MVWHISSQVIRSQLQSWLSTRVSCRFLTHSKTQLNIQFVMVMSYMVMTQSTMESIQKTKFQFELSSVCCVLVD